MDDRFARKQVRKLTGYEQQFPTWSDLAREQVRRRGVPYFEDVEATIRSQLVQLSPGARKAFALARAESLMKQHERLPNQRPFTMSWRPVLDVMWLVLEGLSNSAENQVREALQAFHDGPFDHNDGQDGPDDADEDAAAASIYASECFLSGDAEASYWAASRAIEAAFVVAREELDLDENDFDWDPSAEPMPLAKESMHFAVQDEMRKQLDDLEMLEREGVTAAVLRSLKR